MGDNISPCKAPGCRIEYQPVLVGLCSTFKLRDLNVVRVIALSCFARQPLTVRSHRAFASTFLLLLFPCAAQFLPVVIRNITFTNAYDVAERFPARSNAPAPGAASYFRKCWSCFGRYAHLGTDTLWQPRARCRGPGIAHPERCEESAHTNATGSDSSEPAERPSRADTCRKLSPPVTEEDYCIHTG